jgi:ABC-type dipeptide/oligopeptide/nickel transport system permease subunit
MVQSAELALKPKESVTPRPRKYVFLRRLLRRPLAVFGIVVIAVFAVFATLSPWVAPYDPIDANFDEFLQPPSTRHVLGTDELGRDVFSRIVYGARVSLTAGLAPIVASMVVGVLFGLVAGYVGGKLDLVITAVMDALLAIPRLVLMLGLTAVLGPSLQNALLVIALTGIPGFARVVRGQVLSVSSLDYVLAARSEGCRGTRILLRHILPNVMAPVIVTAALRVGGGIMAEASLSFLGLGVQPPTPSWGVMVALGNRYIQIAPWLAIAPGAAIFLITLAANFVGDGLRQISEHR